MDLRDSTRLFEMETAAGLRRQVVSVKEHYQLIDLAESGDTEAIAGLIARHIKDRKPGFRRRSPSTKAWLQLETLLEYE